MKTLQLTTLAALLAALAAASSAVASNTAEENDISTSSARPVSPVLEDLDYPGRMKLFFLDHEVPEAAQKILTSPRTEDAKRLELYKVYVLKGIVDGYIKTYNKAIQEVRK